MNRFKQFFVVSALLCSAVSMRADGFRSVEVKCLDGSTTCINLSDNLKTEFKNDKVVFSDGDLLFEFNRTKVDSFIFSETVGIETAKADACAPVLGAGSMSFYKLPENSRIQVITMNGSIAANVVVSGNYSLDLNGWAAGIYIVKVNGLSYKVMVKK